MSGVLSDSALQNFVNGLKRRHWGKLCSCTLATRHPDPTISREGASTTPFFRYFLSHAYNQVKHRFCRIKEKSTESQYWLVGEGSASDGSRNKLFVLYVDVTFENDRIREISGLLILLVGKLG